MFTGAYMGGAVTYMRSDVSDGPETQTRYSYGWGDSQRQSIVYHKPNEDNSLEYNTQYEYNLNGKLLMAYVNDGSPSKTAYATDVSGQILWRGKLTNVGAVLKQHFYVYFNGMRVGDTGNDTPGEIDYATTINERGDPNPPATVQSADFDQSYTAIGPQHAGSGSSWTVRDGDTLQSIAAAVWGDASLWYLIADANGLSGSDSLIAGQMLAIPAAVANVHNTSDTFRPYDPNKAIGDNMPVKPKPVPDKRCSGAAVFVALIAMAVMAVVAPYAIAAVQGAMGAAGGALATAGGHAIANVAVAGAAQASLTATVVGSAIAGAAGSIVSQGVGMAIGYQDKFDWKQVGMAAIGAGVSAGLGHAMSPLANIGNPILRGTIQAAASSAITQGIGVATGLQDKFSWAEVAAAGVGAAVGGYAGTVKGLAPFAGAIGSIAGAGAKSLIDGSSFGDNLQGALPAIIMSTVGGMAERGALNEAGSSHTQYNFGSPDPVPADELLYSVDARSFDLDTILASIDPRWDPSFGLSEFGSGFIDGGPADLSSAAATYRSTSSAALGVSAADPRIWLETKNATLLHGSRLEGGSWVHPGESRLFGERTVAPFVRVVVSEGSDYEYVVMGELRGDQWIVQNPYAEGGTSVDDLVITASRPQRSGANAVLWGWQQWSNNFADGVAAGWRDRMDQGRAAIRRAADRNQITQALNFASSAADRLGYSDLAQELHRGAIVVSNVEAGVVTTVFNLATGTVEGAATIAYNAGGDYMTSALERGGFSVDPRAPSVSKLIDPIADRVGGYIDGRYDLNADVNGIITSQVNRTQRAIADIMSGDDARLARGSFELASQTTEALTVVGPAALKTVSLVNDMRLLSTAGRAISTEAIVMRTVWQGGACFVAGTLVHTREGLKPIEQVAVGDWVLAQPEFTGEIQHRKVVDTFVVGERPVFEVTIRDVRAREQVIRATSEHPFWVQGRGWVGVNELAAGDALELYDRSQALVEAVVDTGSVEPVFNFAVEGFHTYYVGEMGVWVHNASRVGDIFAAESLAFATGKFVPNPYGRLGGPAHQALVAEITADIRLRGLTPKPEFRILTPDGAKSSRFVDVAALDPVTKLPVEFYQVGKQTLAGNPISREALAIRDIQVVTKQPVTFRPYNPLGG